jgi:hypothetical protein
MVVTTVADRDNEPRTIDNRGPARSLATGAADRRQGTSAHRVASTASSARSRLILSSTVRGGRYRALAQGGYESPTGRSTVSERRS